MAAELAGGLAVGCSCPVCGSIDHPAPATASATVGRADEEAARDHYEYADFERQTVQELVTTLATRLQGALVRCGGHAVTHWRSAATGARQPRQPKALQRKETARCRERAGRARAGGEGRRHRARLVSGVARGAHPRAGRGHRAPRPSRRRAGRTARRTPRHQHRRRAGHGPPTSGRRPRGGPRGPRQAGTDRARAGTGSRSSRRRRRRGRLPVAHRCAGCRAPGRRGGRAVRGSSTSDGPRAQPPESTSPRSRCVAALAEEPPDLVGLAAQLAESGRGRDEQHAAHEQAALRVQRLETLARGAVRRHWRSGRRCARTTR